MIWLALIAVIVAAPFALEALRKPVEQRRNTMPGRLVSLSRGKTHLVERGPKDGPPVVLVHGLTTPCFVFGPICDALTAQGYRTITYDHYGRGYSDRPIGLQDAAFYRNHLCEVLEAAEVRTPAIFIGYSMGGAIICDFAAHEGARVAKTIAIAPAGANVELGGLIRRAIQVPFFGSWLMHAIYPRQHMRGTEAERDLPSAITDVVDMQQDELRYRGFVAAVLSSARGILSGPQENAHRAISAGKVAYHAIWGAADEVVLLSSRDAICDWNPHSTHTTIDGAGHGLPYTHSAEVIAAIRVAINS